MPSKATAPLTFFSKLREALTSSPMETMTAKQAKKLIANSGAPQRELNFTGILNSLPVDPDQKVTRQSLLDALEARPLKLKTTRRASAPDAPSFSFMDEPDHWEAMYHYDSRTGTFDMDEWAVGGYLQPADDSLESESLHALVRSQILVDEIPEKEIPGIVNEINGLYGDSDIVEETTRLLQTDPKQALLKTLKAYEFPADNIPSSLRSHMNWNIFWPDGTRTNRSGDFDAAVNHVRRELESSYVPDQYSQHATRYGYPDYRSRGALPPTGTYGEVTLELDRPPLHISPDDPNPLAKIDDPENTPFTSGHWDQPDTVSHYRYTTDRPLLSSSSLPPDQRPRHWHNEEFQSDWAEQARDHGILGQPAYRPDQLTYKALSPTEYEVIVPPKPGPYNQPAHYSIQASSEQEAYDRLIHGAPDLFYGTIPPGPYTKTNDWEQLTLRTALADAINQGYDVFTWPMGREHFRRYPGGDQILSGNIASSDIRAVNYFNKLLKPYNARVTHDRLLTNPEIPRAEEFPLNERTSLQVEPDLFGATLRTPEGTVRGFEPAGFLDRPSDLTGPNMRKVIVDSARREHPEKVRHAQERAQVARKLLIEELVQNTDRVHRIDITPEMREMFKKGIPLTLPPLSILSSISSDTSPTPAPEE